MEMNKGIYIMITKMHVLSVALLSASIVAATPAPDPIYEKAKQMITKPTRAPKIPWRTMSQSHQIAHATDVVLSSDLVELLWRENRYASYPLAREIEDDSRNEFAWINTYIGIIPFRQLYRLYKLEKHLQKAEQLRDILTQEEAKPETLTLIHEIVKNMLTKLDFHKQNMHYYVANKKGEKRRSFWASFHTAWTAWFKK
jgi:hypothetical protein